MGSSTTTVKIQRYHAGATPRRCPDQLAEEEPLEIQVEGRSISVTMRTPGHDEELAVGFLLGEGVIRTAQDLSGVRPYPRNAAGNVVLVHLQEGAPVDLKSLSRHVFMSSSCGLCGKASIREVHRSIAPLKKACVVRREVILRLPDLLREGQRTFEATGGLHAAALFRVDGELRVVREDVGRHNAVDKVLGHALMAGWLPLEDHLLMVSGRVSFEIVQKALAARVGGICAVSAPTSLAVQFAKRNRQLLVGFLRGDRFNVYACPGSVVGENRGGGRKRKLGKAGGLD